MYCPLVGGGSADVEQSALHYWQTRVGGGTYGGGEYPRKIFQLFPTEIFLTSPNTKSKAVLSTLHFDSVI